MSAPRGHKNVPTRADHLRHAKVLPGTSASTSFEEQLFGTTNVSGGIRFDFGDVATTLDDTKGYTQYLRLFIQDMADINDGNRILSALPGAKDWYIQAGTVKTSVSYTLAANDHEWRNVA